MFEIYSATWLHQFQHTTETVWLSETGIWGNFSLHVENFLFQNTCSQWPRVQRSFLILYQFSVFPRKMSFRFHAFWCIGQWHFVCSWKLFPRNMFPCRFCTTDLCLLWMLKSNANCTTNYLTFCRFFTVFCVWFISSACGLISSYLADYLWLDRHVSELVICILPTIQTCFRDWSFLRQVHLSGIGFINVCYDNQKVWKNLGICTYLFSLKWQHAWNGV